VVLRQARIALANEADMGITLFDLKNEVTSFHINFWNWRPIVEAVRRLQVLPDERVAALHEPFCNNGLSKEEARLVADALESRILATLEKGERVLLDGTRTSEPDDLVFHKIEQEKNYSATRPALEGFIAFCRACSGFEVL
jgi:hypothetical protein